MFMKTNIYIDGFNLYYGCVKDTPYKWLNLAKMCRLLLPCDEIIRIKYFTALVTPRPSDLEKPIRQRLNLRALLTIPNLEIIYGSFLSSEVRMPLSPPDKGFARVIKTEEKGSDVNLATHLLLDGFRNDYELAVIEQFGKPVGLLNPQKHPSAVLVPHVLFVKNIRKNVLYNSQFPDVLSDAHGIFRKPATW